jgi:cyanophycin synthetase
MFALGMEGLEIVNMRIASIQVVPGPNVHHEKGVLVMRLHLDDLSGVESFQVPGFIERLIATLPGIKEHRCSIGRAGGFIERLHDGTYFGHVIEHIALELSTLAGIEVGYGRTYSAGALGVYDVIVRYKAEAAMIYLLHASVDLAAKLVANENFSLRSCIAEAHDIVADAELGPSTRTIVEAAEARNIPWVRLNNANLVQLGYGRKRRLIQAAMTDMSNGIAVEISCDKELTKLLLRRALLPVPRGTVVRSEEDAVLAFSTLGQSCVVKPLDGRQGKGVSVDLKCANSVRAGYRLASQICPSVIVEEYVTGRNYRVLVVNNKMVAAAERIPPMVVGDGERPISELIEAENRDPRRGKGHNKALTIIEVDEMVISCLSAAGLDLQSVPRAGQKVMLRESVNLSTGGSASDVTDQVCEDVRFACERAASVIGLDICGIDLVHSDVAIPLADNGAIIEVNAAPGLRMHIFPNKGEPQQVGASIVEMLYPAGLESRIPIISITGTNGKTTTARMISHVILSSGTNVGMTTTDGVYVGGRLILADDSAGPASARAILGDPTIEAAVLETARGGIVRRGLGYDWADIAVITNITADHIGQDGIESIEDIVRIKSIVAERVKEKGTLVLNADDSRVVNLADLPRVQRQRPNIIYFSLYAENPVIINHIANGGRAYFVRAGRIYEAGPDGEKALMEVAAVPITMGGLAQYQVANTLAAVAACRAYGLRTDDLMKYIQSFKNQINPGRGNFYAVENGVVMVDYGHNPAAFQAVCHFAKDWYGSRTTAIITVPGDRRNDLVEECARVAALGFDRLIIREDQNLRGRHTGEISALMCRTARELVPHLDCRTIQDELIALEFALKSMMPGELIVHFYENDLVPVVELLSNYGAKAIETLPTQQRQIAKTF